MPNSVARACTFLHQIICHPCEIVWCVIALLSAWPQPLQAAQQASTTEDIQFTNSGGALGGTLYRAKQGSTALTFDKRGVGEPGGVYAGPEVGTNNVEAANLKLLACDSSRLPRQLSARSPALRT